MLLPKILLPHLYNCKSPLEVAEALRNEMIPYVSDSVKQDQARKLEEYINILSDSQYKLLVISLANSIIEVIADNFPDLKFDCEGREKSLVSFVEKMLYLQYKGRSLDTIKDIIGLRIVTKNASIERLYEVAELVFNFFVLRNYQPCNLKTTESGKFKQEEYPQIEVPKKCYLSKHILPFVKDYVFDPKGNGYQSIHFVFFKSKIDRYIEIQVRTQKMDVHAMFGEKNDDVDELISITDTNETEGSEKTDDASHHKYKAKRKKYVQNEEVDIMKISMEDEGFIAISPEKYTDRCGLIDAKTIIKR